MAPGEPPKRGRENSGGNSAKNVSSVSTPAGASISLDHGDDGPVRFADLITEDAERFVSDILNRRFRSLGEAEKAKANALAAKHLTAALRDSRSVVSRAKAEDALFEQIRVARDAFLKWPSKVAPLIAANLEIDADRLQYELDEHMWTQLEDLRSMEAIDFYEGSEG